MRSQAREISVSSYTGSFSNEAAIPLKNWRQFSTSSTNIALPGSDISPEITLTRNSSLTRQCSSNIEVITPSGSIYGPVVNFEPMEIQQSLWPDKIIEMLQKHICEIIWSHSDIEESNCKSANKWSNFIYKTHEWKGSAKVDRLLCYYLYCCIRKSWSNFVLIVLFRVSGA